MGAKVHPKGASQGQVAILGLFKSRFGIIEDFDHIVNPVANNIKDSIVTVGLFKPIYGFISPNRVWLIYIWQACVRGARLHP